MTEQPKAMSQPAEQLRYARLLDWGTRIGLVVLVLSFAAYMGGLTSPHVPLERLAALWGQPVSSYLQQTQAPLGWGWLALVRHSDVAGLIGIVILAGCSLVCLLAVVPLLTAVPSLFHELANSKLLHDAATGTAGAVAAAASAAAASSADAALGASELIPAAAILPFMLYQLAGYGTLHFVLPKAGNVAANLGILALIVAAFVANRAGNFGAEKALVGVLIAAMLVLVFYGVLKLRSMQQRYDDFHPDKAKDKKAAA